MLYTSCALRPALLNIWLRVSPAFTVCVDQLTLGVAVTVGAGGCWSVPSIVSVVRLPSEGGDNSGVSWTVVRLADADGAGTIASTMSITREMAVTQARCFLGYDLAACASCSVTIGMFGIFSFNESSAS